MYEIISENQPETSKHKQRLFTPVRTLAQDILLRIGIVIALIIFASILLWFQRDGLYDAQQDEVDLLDTIYFTVMTLTTTGYGDITPISSATRAFITFTMTPIRIIIWFIFFSAAYQLIIRAQWENWRIRQMEKHYKDHVIICGFGVSGQTAAKELLSRGYKKNQIVVVDQSEESMMLATQMGISGICGDATKERNLIDAKIDKASYVIVTVHQDQACTLICLTAKDLSPNIHLVAACKNQENRRLIYQSGAQVVIAPSVSGGSLLAAAISSPVSAKFIDELAHFGHGLDLIDHVVSKKEAGKTISEITCFDKTIVLGMKLAGKRVPFDEIQEQKLNEGDVLVLLKSSIV